MSQLQYEDRPDGFPIGAAVFGAISLPIRHFWTFLRAGWLPILIYGAVTFVTTYLQYTRAMEILSLGPDDVDEMVTLAAMNGVSSLIGMVSLILLIPAITNWVRLAAVGPPPDGRFPAWEFGSREWLYLWRYIVVLFVSTVIFGITAVVMFGAGTFISPILSLPVIVIGLVVVAYLYGRLVPYLGAAALGDPLGWGGSFAVTRDSGGRLFWTVTFFSAVIYCIFVILTLVALSVGGMIFPAFPTADDGMIDPILLFEYFADNHQVLFGWIAVNVGFALLLILWMSVFFGRIYGYFRKR